MFGSTGLQTTLASCSGAEVQLLGDGSYRVRLVELARHKKLIEIVSKQEFSGGLPDIIKGKVSGPLALSITGKGVLIKKTKRLDHISEQSLQHLFPQLKLGEFYLQHFVGEEFSFIGLIRKEIADAIIAAFKELNIPILMLSLGPFIVDQIIPQLNSYGTALSFDGHQVLLSEEKLWTDYTYHPDAKSQFPIKVDIEVIPEQFLLAYATAFQLMLNTQLDLIAVEDEAIQENLQELSAQLKFQKHGGFALLAFFVLLLANFLLLGFYNSENEALSGKLGQKSDVVENRQKLEDEVKVKERLVQKLGWNKGYRYAYLSDQIGQTLPLGIKLDELQINPLWEIRAGLTGDIQQDFASIRIKGQTKSVNAINDWIYLLKDKKWVKEVKLEKYTVDDQKQAQVFTLHLTY